MDDNIIKEIKSMVIKYEYYWDFYTYFKNKYLDQVEFNKVMIVGRELFIDKRFK